jgi:hypothetical protein
LVLGNELAFRVWNSMHLFRPAWGEDREKRGEERRGRDNKRER